MCGRERGEGGTGSWRRSDGFVVLPFLQMGLLLERMVVLLS